ncbi:MAG: hypothetical protein J6J11_01740 [Treponema sp.]|nr:hypothetical protein [Clostridia bacterium]MBP3607026.1 hypothetical protein [Treponema sp.]
MTLKEANEELKKLDNEYNYWLKEKEIALSMVLPKATDVRLERVDGGSREDRLLKYVEVLDNKKIDETLDYIHKKRCNLMYFIENELKRLGQYSEIEKRIYDLRNDDEYVRTHNRKREWWKVAELVGLSSRQVQRINSKAIGKRIDEKNERCHSHVTN